jgi:hypothetical protein
MTFYTQVLSKLVGRVAPRLVVRFEVGPGQEVSPALVDEVRLGLRELGLSEELERESPATVE